MKHFEPVHAQEIGEAAKRIVAQMLVIDGVVLEAVHQPDHIMRLRDEYAVGSKQRQDALDDRMHVLDMGKAVRRSDHPRGAILAPHAGGNLGRKIALQGRDAARGGDLHHIGRLDPEGAVAAVNKRCQ